ncbi:MAG: hypothetical protein O9332_06935 [Microcystis sp. LE19-10.1B]|jgi:hypothetical protein|uniref:Pepco domain-containing protein n=1 Tax=Microcystis sp. LE19-10.1B TaxID=3016428 RepID=UPI0022C678BD|nr:hypothetical protein [Microcystis sp. LE19-10.1B]MCZ8025179.1 hypothetical protein [Microcystis sp. LE19-10.1B]MCZ8362642.1 hypothetical protein [Microcystis sp. LE19-251.1A]
MSETTSRGIWIISDETAVEEGEKSGTDIGPDYTSEKRKGSKRSRITAEDLKQNMEEFLGVVEEAFDKTENPESGMKLDEVELSVEINAKGQVSLLGTGGEAGAKGTVVLKFKRKDG